MKPRYPLTILAICLGLAGCEGERGALPRQAVSGQVLYEGQPLPQGTIQFLPTSSDQATMGLASIKEGRYALARDRGLVPGTYKAVISSSAGAGEGTEVNGMPGKPGPPAKDVIPKKYNLESALKIDVKEGQADPFDFDLKK
jgi:hypothetical protein